MNYKYIENSITRIIFMLSTLLIYFGYNAESMTQKYLLIGIGGILLITTMFDSVKLVYPKN